MAKLVSLDIALLLVGLALLGAGVGLTLDTILSVRCPDFEVRGRRAANRLRGLKDSGIYPPLLQVIRFMAGYAALIKAPRLRARLELWLQQADEPLGLVPTEIMGICLLAGLVAALAASLLLTPLLGIPALLMGMYMPYERVRALAQERIVSIGASLPTYIDLLVLSMTAGMDFVGAVRLLVAKTDVKRGKMPIRDELLIFLNQLDLGRTRQEAMENLARRVPADSVLSFTAACIQAEQKGIPLRNVLRIQAEVLRQKRLADSLAYVDTANLKMLGPIMLVIVALMIVILAPVLLSVGDVVNGGGGNLFP
ncbi:MAG TPA: type II secretion system F family protein [Pseudomonadota bacterium]|nr:type II secretion system F family protein [Pseudomonadota bacterium]